MANEFSASVADSNAGFKYLGVNIYRSFGKPTVTTDIESGAWCVDQTNEVTYQFLDGAWVDVSSIGRFTSVASTFSEGTAFTRVFRVGAALFDGNANSIYSVPANVSIEDISLLVTEGVGSAATVNVGTDDNAAWALGGDDADGFVAALSIENAGFYRMSRLDLANQPALGLSGALTGADGGSLILTSAADYSGSSVDAIVKVSLVSTEAAALN